MSWNRFTYNSCETPYNTKVTLVCNKMPTLFFHEFLYFFCKSGLAMVCFLVKYIFPGLFYMTFAHADSPIVIPARQICCWSGYIYLSRRKIRPLWVVQLCLWFDPCLKKSNNVNGQHIHWPNQARYLLFLHFAGYAELPAFWSFDAKRALYF